MNNGGGLPYRHPHHKVTVEPAAPRMPSFLFQKPASRSIPNNHSEAR